MGKWEEHGVGVPAPPALQLTALEIREAFKVFDRDGNGFISKQELGTAMRSLGYMPNEVELEVIIQRLDMDGDGQVDFEEFVTLLGPKLSTSGIPEKFHGTDFDTVFWKCDMQKLTVDELKRLLYDTFCEHLSMKDIENIIMTEEESHLGTPEECPVEVESERPPCPWAGQPRARSRGQGLAWAPEGAWNPPPLWVVLKDVQARSEASGLPQQLRKGLPGTPTQRPSPCWGWVEGCRSRGRRARGALMAAFPPDILFFFFLSASCPVPGCCPSSAWLPACSNQQIRQTCVRKSLICAFAIAFIISVMLIAANQVLRSGMK
uniref:Calcium binding protein 7 n=1 Tax=Monodelphis domestica TaxID=13616 RepID=A0A5F8GQ61_MONDO